ncbi:MAG: multidrug efflux SMR transporter [Dehalococcoidia bacterium]|nr:multidrug efflux SMR transporter [Dehalococcoidia bacterium]
MPWILLVAAIFAEVTGTLALRASEGFTKPLPAVIVVIAYAVTFLLLGLVLKWLPVGPVYAIWAGLGTALVAIAGVVLFAERLSLAGIGGIVLIVAGVAILNVTGAGQE